MASESKNDATKGQTKPTPTDATKTRRELSDEQLSGIAGGAGEMGPAGVFPTKGSGNDEAMP